VLFRSGEETPKPEEAAPKEETPKEETPDAAVPVAPEAQAEPEPEPVAEQVVVGSEIMVETVEETGFDLSQLPAAASSEAQINAQNPNQIGRASCRERV